jgi:catechol-2,3-dioxygenase
MFGGAAVTTVVGHPSKEGSMTTFPAVTHVAVTVTDLGVSVPWYKSLFDAEPVLDEDTGPFRHVVFLIGGGMLFGLHQFPGATGTVAFDPRRPGLDHVAFACADRAELEGWQKRLDDLGVTHGGIVDAHYGSGLSFKDPDNLALEFFAPPA